MSRGGMGPIAAPKRDSRRGYIFVSAAVETSFHILFVELATSPTATPASRKIRARIIPYSTAVAALVDPIRLQKLHIFPNLTAKYYPRVSQFAQQCTQLVRAHPRKQTN